jgi:hypothetical protein
MRRTSTTTQDFPEVLRRVEGRKEKKDIWYRKSLTPSLKLSRAMGTMEKKPL